MDGRHSDQRYQFTNIRFTDKIDKRASCSGDFRAGRTISSRWATDQNRRQIIGTASLNKLGKAFCRPTFGRPARTRVHYGEPTDETALLEFLSYRQHVGFRGFKPKLSLINFNPIGSDHVNVLINNVERGRVWLNRARKEPTSLSLPVVAKLDLRLCTRKAKAALQKPLKIKRRIKSFWPTRDRREPRLHDGHFVHRITTLDNAREPTINRPRDVAVRMGRFEGTRHRERTNNVPQRGKTSDQKALQTFTA